MYYPDTQSVPFFAAARVLNRPHCITADVDIPERGRRGVLLAQGTAAGGYTFYVKDGQLRYAHNYLGSDLRRWHPKARCPRAPTRCASSSSRRAAGLPRRATGCPDDCSSTSTASWWAIGRRVHNAMIAFNPGALTCGADPGSSVTVDVRGAIQVHGHADTVTVDLSGELIVDSEAELKRAHGAPIATDSAVSALQTTNPRGQRAARACGQRCDGDWLVAAWATMS